MEKVYFYLNHTINRNGNSRILLKKNISPVDYFYRYASWVSNMEVEGVGSSHTTERPESDIYSLSNSNEGLTVLIATVDEDGQKRSLRVYFEWVRGFRYLDEGDLIYYWESKAFTSPYHVFKVLSGGWSNGESLQPGILSVSTAIDVSEWFVATTNGCVNVLTNANPVIEYINA